MVRIGFHVCFQPSLVSKGFLNFYLFFFNLFQAALAGSIWDMTQNSVL